MAVNEQIVTGRKFRKLIDEANKLWQRISFWTKASDVEFNDGKNAETKFGAINGVTDSLTSTASNIAASAKAVKTLNDKVTQLSSNIFGLKHKSVTLNPVALTPVTLEAMPNKLVIVIYYGAAAIYDVANKKFLLNRCDSAAGVGIDMIQNLQNNGKNFSVYYCHSASTPGEIYYL